MPQLVRQASLAGLLLTGRLKCHSYHRFVKQEVTLLWEAKTDNVSSVMHIYEPVPDFYSVLDKSWRSLSTEKQWAVRVHKVGLGDTNRTVYLSSADLKGQETFGMENTQAGDDTQTVELEIMEASHVLRKVMAGAEDLDLLHVNCEGCEYEMFDNIIQSGLTQRIK